MTLMIRQPSNAIQTTDQQGDPYTPSRFQTMMEMAKALHAGGLVKGAKNAEAVVSLMLLCDAQGVHPGNALQWYHVIEGKPSMTAAAMQSRFQAVGGKIRWGAHNAQEVEAWFSHPEMHPDEYYVRVEFEDMKTRKIAMTYDDKEGRWVLKNTWARYPEDMLSSRVVARGIRRIAPGVILGIYTPEEIVDAESDNEGPAVTVTASSARPAPTPPKPAKPVPATEPTRGIDIPLPGQEGDHDSRSFAEVVKATVLSINEVAEVALGVPPITSIKQALAAIKRALESSKVIEQGTTFKNEGEGMKILTALYRDHREPMRKALFVHGEDVHNAEAKRLKDQAAAAEKPMREIGEEG